jgi:ERF superfamily protein
MKQAELVHVETVPAAPDEQTQVLSRILAAMENPAFPPDALERMYGFHRQMKADAARDAFWIAMKQAQEEIRPVARDAEIKGSGGAVQSRYAKLETIDKAIRPIYLKYGFCLSFNSRWNEDKNLTVVECQCSREGHIERYELGGALDTVGDKGTTNKTPIKGLGSTITYLKRYLTCMIFNIQMANEDDDGAGASTPKPITQDQADTITSLLDACGMDTREKRAGFYAWADIKSVAELPEHKYTKAVIMLQAKQKQRGL